MHPASEYGSKPLEMMKAKKAGKIPSSINKRTNNEANAGTTVFEAELTSMHRGENDRSRFAMKRQ